MAELTTKEKLQPSLLDRLTDEEPQRKQESRDRRVLSLRRLRQCVLRDLEWLLNAGSLAATQDLEDYPLVRRSVLNYGMPELAGCFASNVDIRAVEQGLRQAILDFEPRILPGTVQVRAIVSQDAMDHNALAFEIEGEVWAQPLPEKLLLKTEIDLENGAVTVVEKPGRRPG